jgi:hypothetical protein
MSKMIQVRDVPDLVHRTLKSRAAREGMSLSTSDSVARAQRDPDGQFPSASRRTRQQEVGGVCPRNHQHQACRHKQDRDRRDRKTVRLSRDFKVPDATASRHAVQRLGPFSTLVGGDERREAGGQNERW